MSNGVNFPKEIMEDILTRLPAKSLSQFKCVSRPWRTLISDPNFIKLHLQKHNQDNERVVLVSQSRSLFSFGFNESSDDNEVHATKVDFQSFGVLDNKWDKVLGSCNGLLLVSDKANTFFLMNPSTHTTQKLFSKTASESNGDQESSNRYGLGYDSSTDDYKVVDINYDIIFHSDDELDYYDWNDALILSCVSVYSLKTGKWKGCKKSGYDHSHYYHSGAFVNGHLHWLARDAVNTLVIVPFDLVDDKFGADLPPPVLQDKYAESVFDKLAVLGGCLCMFVGDNDDEASVWVMKKYGVKESWTELKFAGLNISAVETICLLRNGEVVLVIGGSRLVIYSPEDESMRDVVVYGVPGLVRGWGAYGETLVSPKYNNGSICEGETSDQLNIQVAGISLSKGSFLKG